MLTCMFKYYKKKLLTEYRCICHKHGPGAEEQTILPSKEEHRQITSKSPTQASHKHTTHQQAVPKM